MPSDEKFPLLQHVRVACVKTALSARCIVATLTLVPGCSQERPAPESPVRAVKIEMGQGASANTSQLLGTVRQHEKTNLIFESQGRIAHIDVTLEIHFTGGRYWPRSI
jgi:hypothetical protein